MKKNIFTLSILVTSLIVSNISAYAEDEDVIYAEIIANPILQEMKPFETIIEGEGPVLIDDIVNNVPVSFSTDTLPSYYNSSELGYVTSPKNQNQYGTCWAFSTISALETSMIKKGYESIDDVDYSETHLAYFAHTVNSFTNDGEKIYDDDLGYYGGGNNIIAGHYLTGWQGAAEDEDFPYPPASKDYIIPESERYNSAVHLQDLYILNEGSVKEAIMEHGSVTMSYNHENSCCVNNSYYRGVDDGTVNHAVTIVGWDDEYDLSNFDALTNKPQNPGAWIIKNSWGPNWGDEGYFYMSYEEPTIRSFVAFSAEPADNYNIIHQYNGATNNMTLFAPKSANIFNVSQNQDLEAVGIYASLPYTEYTVDIYKLNKNYTSPEDGTKVATISGAEEFVGFHTIKLSEAIPLSKGDNFSVVCTAIGLYNMDYIYYSSFEGATVYEELDNSSAEGESYIYSGGDWQDAHYLSYSGTNLNNAAIKAYSSYHMVDITLKDGENTISEFSQALHSHLDIPATPEKEGFYFAGWYKDSDLTTPWNFEEDMIESETTLYAKWSETPIAVEAIDFDASEGGVMINNTFYVEAAVSPYYATDKTLIWSSSDSSVATVENGVITGVSKGNATISASSSNGIVADFSISVYNPMTNVQFGLKKPIFKTTDCVEISILEPEAKYFTIHFITSSNKHLYTNKINNSETGDVINVRLSPLSADNYIVWIEAEDYLGNTLESAKKSIKVTDDLVLVAAKTSTGIMASGYNNDTLGELICSYYDSEGNFMGAFKKANSEYPSVTFSDIAGAKSYKIMWWDSISAMNAITTSVNIE